MRKSKRSWFREVHEAAKMNASYERYMQDTCHGWQRDAAYLPTPPQLLGWWLERFYIVALAQLVWDDVLRLVVCGRKGHLFEDTGSWAGPESGGEDLTCSRCGFHVRHVMY